jgi:hypothetical protein
LDSGVGKESAAGEDGKAAGEAERQAGGEIFHGGGKKVRIFTASSDIIRHRPIRNRRTTVMLCEFRTDKSTMYRVKVAPQEGVAIGYLIAC